MKDMTKEEVHTLFPLTKKLDKQDLMQLFFDITKMILLNKEDNKKSDIFNALGCLIAQRD